MSSQSNSSLHFVTVPADVFETLAFVDIFILRCWCGRLAIFFYRLWYFYSDGFMPAIAISAHIILFLEMPPIAEPTKQVSFRQMYLFPDQNSLFSWLRRRSGCSTQESSKVYEVLFYCFQLTASTNML